MSTFLTLTVLALIASAYGQIGAQQQQQQQQQLSVENQLNLGVTTMIGNNQLVNPLSSPMSAYQYGLKRGYGMGLAQGLNLGYSYNTFGSLGVTNGNLYGLGNPSSSVGGYGVNSYYPRSAVFGGYGGIGRGFGLGAGLGFRGGLGAGLGLAY